MTSFVSVCWWLPGRVNERQWCRHLPATRVGFAHAHRLAERARIRGRAVRISLVTEFGS